MYLSKKFFTKYYSLKFLTHFCKNDQKSKKSKVDFGPQKEVAHKNYDQIRDFR